MYINICNNNIIKYTASMVQAQEDSDSKTNTFLINKDYRWWQMTSGGSTNPYHHIDYKCVTFNFKYATYVVDTAKVILCRAQLRIFLP